MSVDLVGSTAFKAEKAAQEYESSRVKPKWVGVFTDFYEAFPQALKRQYVLGEGKLVDGEKDLYPRIWKTIGDEIILCSRILNIEHLAHTMDSFIATLKEYSVVVKRADNKLDVKGNAWVAACPAPNFGFALNPKEAPDPDGLDTSEATEAIIDLVPHKYDFLGKAIDTGFRVSKNSRADRCTVSAQLAFVLAEAEIRRLTNFKLDFDGRTELKGVNNGIPYPVVFIDTETDDNKIDLIYTEKELSSKNDFKPEKLKAFLAAFMKVASIDHPYICRRNQELPVEDKPESFVNFEKAFRKLIEGIEQQDKTFADAEMAPDAGDDVANTEGAILDSTLDGLIEEADNANQTAKDEG